MRKISFALSALMALTWSAAALADGECSENTDCAEGYMCARGASVPGCSEPPCVDTPVVEEVGSCVKAPVTCESDADCGEYLRCVQSSDGTCWVDSDGNTGCDEPDDAPQYCSATLIHCSQDSDCPREFECITYTSDACPDIACAEDSPDCMTPCHSQQEQICEPKRIECEDDGDCPTDWRCSGASTLPDPIDTGETEPRPSEMSERTVAKQCYPDGWMVSHQGITEGDLAAGPDDSGGSQSNEAKSSSSGGGCSVTAAGAGSSASWLAALLLAVPFVRRRTTRSLAR